MYHENLCVRLVPPGLKYNQKIDQKSVQFLGYFTTFGIKITLDYLPQKWGKYLMIGHKNWLFWAPFVVLKHPSLSNKKNKIRSNLFFTIDHRPKSCENCWISAKKVLKILDHLCQLFGIKVTIDYRQKENRKNAPYYRHVSGEWGELRHPESKSPFLIGQKCRKKYWYWL